MGVIRNLIVRVGADLSDFEKNFNKMQKQIDKVGRNFEKIGSTLMQGVTLPLGAVAAAGIKAASDLQEVQNVVDVAFGSSAKAVDEWSKTTLKAYGLTELQAKKYAGTTRAVVDSMGVTGKAADQMSLTLAGLAGDIASFYNLPIEEAFAKIQSGMTGETMPLKQIGINMNIVNLEAYAMAKGIKKAYEEMSLAEQTTLRYNYLMDTTKNAQGDFARTSDSFANTMRVLQGQFQAVSGELMAGLLPTLTGMMNKVKEAVSWFSSLDAGTKNNIASFLLIAAAIGPVVFAIGKMIAVTNIILTTIKTLSTAMLFLASGPIFLVIGAIAALTAGFYLYKNRMTEAEKEVQKLTESHKQAEKAAYDSERSENAKLNTVEKLIPRLDELSQKENRNAKEKAEMQGIVDKLNQAMPDLALNIDNETGALNRQVGQIYKAVTAYRDLARAKAISNVMVSGEETKLSLEETKKKLEGDKAGWVNRYVEGGGDLSSSAYQQSGAKVWIDRIQKDINNVDKQISEIDKKNDTYSDTITELEIKGNNALNKIVPNRKTVSTIASGYSKINDAFDDAVADKKEKADKAAKEAEQARQEQIQKEIRDNKFNKDMGWQTEAEYYKNLAILRDAYFDKGSQEWQQYTLDIKEYNEKNSPYNLMLEGLVGVKSKVQNAVSIIGNAFELYILKSGIASNSTDYFTSKIRALQEQADALNPAITETQIAYDIAAATFGATSIEAMGLKDQLTALQLDQAKYTKEIMNTTDALLKQAAAQQALQKLLNPSVKTNFASNFEASLANLQSLKQFGYSSKQIYDLAVKNATTQTVEGAEKYSKGGGQIAGDIIIQSVAQTPADIASAVKRGLQQAVFGMG